MASELLSAFPPRATDANNDPYSGAKWKFYVSGTLTPQNVYADADLNTSLGATVTADSAGKFVPIYFDASNVYRGILENSTGSTTLYDIDPINSEWLALFASGAGADEIGFIQAGTGAVAETVQTALRRFVYVNQFGADATGAIPSDTAFTGAAAQAVTIGATLLIAGGTYLLDGWIPPAGLEIVGAGQGETTLKRKGAAVNNNAVIELQNGRNTIRDLTIDGNKSAQTLASQCLSVTNGGAYRLENLEVKNAKQVAGGYGSGLAIVSTDDGADNTQSQIVGLTVTDCDADGIYVDEVYNLLIDRNNCKGNGGSGIALTNYDSPLEPDSQRQIQVTDNNCLDNNGSGIVVSGTTVNNVLPPIGNFPARAIVIDGNVCIGNDGYGIAAQSSGTAVTGNTCLFNGNDGAGRITFAGILFNCYGSVCSGNTAEQNEYYGIDAGGAFECVVSANIVRFNGNATANNGTGINVGAAVRTIVEANNVVSNGSTGAGVQIYVPAYDSNGTTLGGLPYRASGVFINGNSITLANNNQVGIYLHQGPEECRVTNNSVTGGTANLSFIVESPSCYVRGNHNGAYIVGYTLASAASLLIPDWVELAVISGNTTCTGGIDTYSRSSFSGKVAWIKVTNGGSGYTSAPSVSITGGGGAGATAQAYIGSDGAVVGVIVTNYGSGYASTPTIGFSGGGGSGATATATVGCDNIVNRELRLVFGGTAQMNNAANLKLAGGVNFTPGGSGHSTLSLIGMYGNAWCETGRAA